MAKRPTGTRASIVVSCDISAAALQAKWLTQHRPFITDVSQQQQHVD